MAHKIKTIEAGMSLHNVMNMIQLRYMAEQAQQVSRHISALLENTFRAAPVRRKPYKLRRPDTPRVLRWPARSPRDEWMEKHWEEACFHAWKDSDAGLDEDVPFRRLVSYQVMLRDQNIDKGWGEVDLLGESQVNTPVIVELKSKASEYLLRAVVEGVAYAVAIKKAWAHGNLRQQWQERVEVVSSPTLLTTVPIAVVAPSYCWGRWKGEAGHGMGFRVQEEALAALHELSANLADRGYPVSFVELQGTGSPAEGGLPMLTGARTVSIA